MKNIYKEYMKSEYYQNLTKQQKRKMNCKRLQIDLCDIPELKPYFSEMYRPIIDNIQRCYRNCFIGFAKIVEDNDDIVDDDDEL
jgi:hypothetical protein